MTQESPTFEQLGLNAALLKAIKHIGYETPSPIQAQAIPVILERRDILGQAQTGTGKTAAFALPILQLIDPNVKSPQVLVLAPTRELAIQVAEAFQSYAAHMKGFHVLPIYGGQGYDQQIRGLKRGVHVVVGTPGRVMDHMRKGTLKLDNLKHLVLDEADEMLRMGFIDDVEWVLEQTPPTRQIALFSATMPTEIAKVANTHLNDPAHIKIKVKTTTAKTIRQRYWPVSGRLGKMEALTRILEVENFDAVIIFVRTKTATVEVAEKLEARGYSAEALNGDITQNIRERTIERLKNGKIDILVATDVAARGLDVDRISLVVNYDIPYDAEAYVHRIGRTGRAGREGDAILFVVRRETRMLRTIEKATGQTIEPMKLPSVADINTQRQLRFKQQVIDTLESEELDLYQTLIENLQKETALNPTLIAAALAKIAQGDEPLLLDETNEPEESFENHRERRDERGRDGDRPERKKRRRDENAEPVDMELFRMEVGKNDGVRPGNIVGAIANEADIDSQYINNIRIFEDYATVELPAGMPKELLQKLRKVWVCQKPMQLSRIMGGAPSEGGKERKNSDRKGSDRKNFDRNSSDRSGSDRNSKPRGKPASNGKPGGSSKSKSGAKPANKSGKPQKPRSRD